MQNNIKSIVIVQRLRGYTAHLRFADSTLDEDICAATHWGIYDRIEQTIFRKIGDRV